MKFIGSGLVAVAGLTYLATENIAIGQNHSLTNNLVVAENLIDAKHHGNSQSNSWRLTKVGGSSDCFIKGEFADGEYRSLDISKNCNKVHAQFTNASAFVEDALGNLMVLDDNRNRLFEFSSAEFEGYESVYPKFPLLTLEPAD